MVNGFITTEVRVITEFMGVTMIESSTFLNREVIVTAKMKTVTAELIE